MQREQLLAKSARGAHTPVTLIGHTRDVLEAARKLFGVKEQPTTFSQSWLRFFRLNEADFEMFSRCLMNSAALHDLGKASEDFQKQLENSKFRQLYRHEHLSGLLMVTEPLDSWLKQDTKTDWDLVLSAVICHHLKADSDSSSDRALGKAQADRSSITIHTDHEDFEELMLEIAGVIGIPPLTETLPHFWREGAVSDEAFHSTCDGWERLTGKRLSRFGRELRKDDHRKRLLYAVRSALMIADAVGSGIVREGKNISEWLDELRRDTPELTYDDVDRKIIQPRITQLEAAGIIFERSDFQREAESYSDRSLLLAPCGSGKTMAAWWWIAGQMKKRAARHCLFLYPTRATTTEGFRDYVAWAPEDTAALLHGTASYELEGLFQNPDDERSGSDFRPDPRLFSLGFWGKQFFSATVDQFFSFMQYRYSAMCLLPVLADAVVVVDEVHSFDRSMFSTLQDFLKEFDVPVLCMTATLPESRQKKLQECGLTVHDAYQDENLKLISEKPRYQVHRATKEEVEPHIRKALADGKKVLWVVNTVHQAQEICRSFAESIYGAELQTSEGIPIYCYHSRFRLCDRQLRHEEMVRAFQVKLETGVLGITTQVCEMGLDLNADLLISETAPVTSLIQRMGRCNRSRAPKDLSESGQIYIYPTTPDRPYSEDDLLGVEEFLNHLSNLEQINQADLEEALRKAPRKAEPKKGCSFLRSGPYAASFKDEFREIEEYNLTAVLDSDVRNVLEQKRNRNPIDGSLLPVPRRFREKAPENPPGFPKFLFIAPSSHYLTLLGFCNEPLSNGDAPSCPLPPNQFIL